MTTKEFFEKYKGQKALYNGKECIISGHGSIYIIIGYNDDSGWTKDQNKNDIIEIEAKSYLYSCIDSLKILPTYKIETKIPEGMEIDRENSTFECIRFKEIKKEKSFKEWYEIFIDFLIENNCLKEYMYNRERDNTHKDKIDDHRNFISYAFKWIRTDEGYDYWDLLNDKWITRGCETLK